MSSDLKLAHKHSSNHRYEVMASSLCGCFYCQSTYSPDSIKEWVADLSGTAICPKCGVDSVLGDASGYPVSDQDFLKNMHQVWFS